MNATLRLLTALVMLAIAQTLTTALGIVLLMLALIAALIHPRETFGFAACLGFLLLVLNAPIACAAALGTIGVAVAIAGRRKGPCRQSTPVSLLLAPPSRN